MATAPTMPAPATAQAHEPGSAGGEQSAAENALLPSVPELGDGHAFHPSAPIAKLPVELEVAVPVRNFRVRNLLSLIQGQVIETQWGHGQDVPLSAGAVRLAWSEFEVVDLQLAVRVTRLA